MYFLLQMGMFFCYVSLPEGRQFLFWLVVEPTDLKNMLVKLGSSSPGVKIQKLGPPPSFGTATKFGVAENLGMNFFRTTL